MKNPYSKSRIRLQRENDREWKALMIFSYLLTFGAGLAIGATIISSHLI